MKKIMLAIVALLPAIVAGQQRTVWDGIYTDAQAERGARVYDQSCAHCHGSDLAGRGWVEGQGYVGPVPPRGPEFHRVAPPLAGPDFIADWSGLPLGDLFERNAVSMPQQAPGSLSRAQYADLLAFLLQKNGFPAGATELPTNAALLQGIALGQLLTALQNVRAFAATEVTDAERSSVDECIRAVDQAVRRSLGQR